MKFGIYINKKKDNLKYILSTIIDELSSSENEIIYLNEQQFISDLLEISIPTFRNSIDYDFLITIGGDGTILSAIRSQYKKEKPILGIHAGKLGFLAESDIENCKEILRLIKDSKFKIESRSLFEIELSTDNENKYICANEIVIDRGKSARTMKVNVYENNIFVNRYEGDGLIISTANGSTAYSLSAGGPIIYPSLDLITITPICSHSLSTRTIVLNGNSNIMIDFPEKRLSRTLTIDGQVEFEIKDNTKINIMTSDKKVHFLLTKESNYFNKLRNKMGWFSSIDDKNNY
tara:strand:+ start:502 stop:1371 length:870 start_codon:yes stop_codon:yes gene_type:complete